MQKACPFPGRALLFNDKSNQNSPAGFCIVQYKSHDEGLGALILCYPFVSNDWSS